MTKRMTADVVIVGASLSAAAAAKRLVDAGYETIALERFGLPRAKPCSGIISPRGHRFLIENFGPLPQEVLHEPTACRGVTFYFPGGVELPMQFDGGMTPHLNRTYSDYWAIKRSGATIHDNMRFIGATDQGTHVDITASNGCEEAYYRARYVIGADGPNSKVVSTLYPGYRDRITWFTVKQHLHEIIECPLDPEYFHYWFHPALGYYTWSHLRNNRQIVGVGYEANHDFRERHERALRYLEERHGVKLGPCNARETSVNNFGLSLINRYVFGRGNIIVTGQAAGFLNMIAEGMSAALHSGAIAGEAVVDAFRLNKPIQEIYRTMIQSEVRRCSDQWNIFKILFGRPHEADFMGTLAKRSLNEKLIVLRDVAKFLAPWGKYNWGRQMLWQAITRQITGGYNPRRWL
ncbi:MAG: NAD(P)/FAD-dependent oxidoreductase [Nitrospiraceae bacterium]|nr:NAD(P)/FAD-dependent oxidoreductase [Nitrospiraceae bacterium]